MYACIFWVSFPREIRNYSSWYVSVPFSLKMFMVMCGGISFSYGRGIRVQNRKGLGNSTRCLKNQFSNYGFNPSNTGLANWEESVFTRRHLWTNTDIENLKAGSLSVANRRCRKIPLAANRICILVYHAPLWKFTLSHQEGNIPALKTASFGYRQEA